jgi:hypothetical protein
MIEVYADIVCLFGGICTIAAALALIIKPIRKRIFNDEEQRNGQRCLLRDAMLKTYYHNKDTAEIRQYEYENFLECYKAYKALGGNSFIDGIYEKVIEWEVIT